MYLLNDNQCTILIMNLAYDFIEIDSLKYIWILIRKIHTKI